MGRRINVSMTWASIGHHVNGGSHCSLGPTSPWDPGVGVSWVGEEGKQRFMGIELPLELVSSGKATLRVSHL